MDNDYTITYYVAITLSIFALTVWFIWLAFYLREKRPQRFKQRQIRERHERRRRIAVSDLMASLPNRQLDAVYCPSVEELQYQANMSYQYWRERHHDLFPFILGEITIPGFCNGIPQYKLPSKLEKIRKTI